jgi:tetratricopeptide (TPR) repeat protein
LFLGEDVGFGSRESVEDCGRVLGQYVDVIVSRTRKHQSLVDFAAQCACSVVNGLSERAHPCQALADLYTIGEHLGGLKKPRLAWIGDGNNVARSLAVGCAKMGFPFDAGEATKELIQILYLMKKSLLFSAQELPLPASFLVDGSGRLAVIYLGPVPVDSLLKDIGHSSFTTSERYKRSAALGGRSLEHDITAKIMQKNEALAFFNFSESLREHGFQREADLQFEELAKLQHTSPNARSLLAEMLFKWGNLLAEQGKWGEAAAATQKAIDKSPKNAKYHYNLGVLRGRLGDPESAQRHYRDALGIQPDLTSAHSNLARLLAKRGKWDEAATHFRETIRTRPNDAETIYNLGVALAKQEKWREAATQFRTALEVRPNFPQARKYLDRAEQNLEQD